MDKGTLEKANELAGLIKEHESALLCFEWDGNQYENYERPEDDQLPPDWISTNPRLIIEYDDCDEMRQQQKIPMVLSDALIEFIKENIKENLSKLKKEFENL